MNAERLADMANDIAAYFRSEPDHAAAVAGMVAHLQRFWEPRMRAQLVRHCRQGAEGLDPLAREALAELQRQADAKANAAPEQA
ncbi:formate dehydrogenase subunit delta [Luteimonas sp. R10]|uniref:formate dehydrogenase subunit delta n=1 Tax=Luteimonas sp. R10 TaxID=3108176 RepID=UPI00308E40F1|nr:formate dehydrogenase subunit delta [Luteimonas sp. R10]